jgi:hypothetical protein
LFRHGLALHGESAQDDIRLRASVVIGNTHDSNAERAKLRVPPRAEELQLVTPW